MPSFEPDGDISFLLNDDRNIENSNKQGTFCLKMMHQDAPVYLSKFNIIFFLYYINFALMISNYQ